MRANKKGEGKFYPHPSERTRLLPASFPVFYRTRQTIVYRNSIINTLYILNPLVHNTEQFVPALENTLFPDWKQFVLLSILPGMNVHQKIVKDNAGTIVEEYRKRHELRKLTEKNLSIRIVCVIRARRRVFTSRFLWNS